MTEIYDNRTGDLKMFDFAGFSQAFRTLGLGFAVCDANGQLVYTSQPEGCSFDKQAATDICKSLFEDTRFVSNKDAVRIDQQRLAVALMRDNSGSEKDLCGFALIDTADAADIEPYTEAVVQMLSQLAHSFLAEAKASRQIEMVSSELSQMYEELVLLHKLSANMNVTESDCNYLQMACDCLTDIVSVEGIAMLVEKQVDDHKQLFIAAGAGLIDIDWHMAAVIEDRLQQEIAKGKESLLDSDVDGPFRYHWPDNIRNIIAVPLIGKEKGANGEGRDHIIIGIMVAINRIGKADFDSIDAKLFNSVANGCAVFIENGRLFNDLKELFVGSLKALTSSIDAKDQYTRGHSERVAFISKWIAEQLGAANGLDKEQIHKVYIAGLLHDIGKMGVDEVVLRKQGRLTDEEYARIKEHPGIGAGILGGIKQMRDIVPGVLSHHEHYDGKGYPNGLSGEQIPLIARIISLADCFDAMTSKRTYREAMTLEQALEEIRNNLGTQFDEKIGRAFLESDVYRLWDMIQDGFKDIYSTEDMSKYGLIAVGTLIR
ncbi:MAG: HD domain-containing phosphohydrolase [Phycisphaerae bacterium]|jgi:HD-GYP domain-containing protein (c-di-GMP phosphodiesterase class II)